MNNSNREDLRQAISAIEGRIRMVRVTDEAAEFITTTGFWLEITRLRAGWRIRAYRQGTCKERTARDVATAVEAARSMATRRSFRRV